MSVINEMLKDLDKRKSLEQHSEQQHPAIVSAAKVDYKLLIIAILVTAIASVSVMSYLQSHQKVTKQVEATPALQSVEHNALELTQQNSVASSTKVSANNAIKTSNTNPLNAVAKVQENSTTKIDTQQSIPAVQAPTADLEIKPSKNNGQVEQPTTQVNSSTLPASSSKVIIKQPEIKTVQAKPKPVVEQQKMSIAPVQMSPEQLANKKYLLAKRALQDKKVSLAEKLLEESIILFPLHSDARKELAALWFGRQAGKQAINLLGQGILLSPNNEEFRIMQARIYASQGAFQQAYKVLSVLANTPNKEYQLAVANMASQAKHHQGAIIAYQKLIVLDPEQSRWWLGLGIALDSDGQYAQATIAYEKSLDIGSLSSNSATFVRQRLAELGD